MKFQNHTSKLVILMFSPIGFENKFATGIDGPDSLMQGPLHLASMINKCFLVSCIPKKNQPT